MTKESVFSANNRLIKQIGGCPMGGSISVVFSDIYMCKIEEDVVKPLKPIFYKRYVNDRYVKRKCNEADTLFDALNSYHPNIKFTLEQNPKKFLDTQIIKENNQIKTQVFVKKSVYPVHWSSKVPFRYKKNAINGELHRARKISSNFRLEVARIKAKFSKAGFPHKVIENTINNFNNVDEELMIPRWLFDERKTIAINLPFSNKNEHFSKKFCEKLEFYTNDKVKFNIIWATRKIKSLFNVKDNVKHLSCVIYQGICNCGNNYIGETIRNAVTRIDEHEQPNGKSEPSKHTKSNTGHKFNWMILLRAPSHRLKRKILEAYFIKQLNPSLNDQVDSEILTLFRYVVT